MPSPTDIKTLLDWLNTPVQYVKGVGPYLSELLAKVEVRTLEDLIYHLPFRYLDRRHISDILAVQPGKNVCVMGEVYAAGEIYMGRKGRRAFEVVLWDHHGYLTGKWFHYPRKYFPDRFKKGEKFLFFGEVTLYRGEKQMVHPEVQSIKEFFEEDELKKHLGIIPVYPSTEGLHQKQWRKFMSAVLADLESKWVETLPPSLSQSEGSISAKQAIVRLHQPEEGDMEALKDPLRSSFHRALAFEELFYLQVGVGLLKRQSQTVPGVSHQSKPHLQEALLRELPFELTQGQIRALEEISKDMVSAKPMNRLLQGDVGSGKTLVAMMASLLAVANGYQTALMVPTEILAEQHFHNFSKWGPKLEVPVYLLTASSSAAQRQEVLAAAQSGRPGIFIGTHALLEEDVQLSKVSLVIVDEQHRFGVRQRLKLIQKGYSPDVLVMTATPIPRSLAMTLYGDLDLSIMTEMPRGRQPIYTKTMNEKDRPKLYDFIRKKILEGQQCYFIFPLVEESEKLDLKDATKAFERLKKEFPEFQAALLHGRMKGAEKEAVMQEFSAGKTHLLVATTVVEVGIDVPNATVMVIEHAERFGLSQLHQLRGRVGRSSLKSYCILAAEYRRSDVARERLKVMETYQDGFKISEEDLKIRGPGDFLGTRQSGIPDFRVANLINDLELLEKAKSAADRILTADPDLSLPEHQVLRAILLHRWKGRLGLAKVG